MTLRPLDGVVVVLVATDGSENAGSVARLCGNFGAQLRFVDVHADLACRDALKMAHPCEGLLEAAPRCGHLDEAVADCALVVATSGKIATAMEQAPFAVERAAGFLPAPGERTAVVFGNERTGLPADVAARCHRVVRLPTPGPFGSFNLASSVAVTLTLFAEAARRAPLPRASSSARARLRATFEDALARRGFYKGRGPESFRPRLDELLNKMDLSERDVEVMGDLVAALAGPP
ncbi:MAG: TrmH family RNA methyltransferase [Kofleriaceae bacterium]|nr:TrmH family RNA methyltransferase [Kofleriaceae bacterium]